MLRLIDASHNIIFDNSFTSTFAWCLVRVMSVSFHSPSPQPQTCNWERAPGSPASRGSFVIMATSPYIGKGLPKTRRTTQQTLKPMKSASITLAKVATVFFSNSPVTCPTLPKFRKKNRMKGIKPELLPQCSGWKMKVYRKQPRVISSIVRQELCCQHKFP